MKKKISLIIIIVLSLFLVTACDEQTNNTINKQQGAISSDNNNGSNDDNSNINDIKVYTGIKKHKKCTRTANAGSNAEVELNYDVYYTDDILNSLISQEKIITEDTEKLDEYEDAYKKIAKNYEGLEYYNQEVVRTNNSVLNKTTIDYDKIDIKKLLDIEGEEDNIIENGKAKVDLYLALLKRFGGTCEDVE